MRTTEQLQEEFLRETASIGQTAMCRKYGLTVQQTSDIVNGRKRVTDGVLEKMGWEKVWVRK